LVLDALEEGLLVVSRSARILAMRPAAAVMEDEVARCDALDERHVALHYGLLDLLLQREHVGAIVRRLVRRRRRLRPLRRHGVAGGDARKEDHEDEPWHLFLLHRPSSMDDQKWNCAPKATKRGCNTCLG